MDLDGYVALNDAQIKTADAEADNAGKWAAAALTWSQVDKQAIANYEQLLKIKWDAQAHANLLRIRDQALQQARTRRLEGDRLRAKLNQVKWLLAGGGDWEFIRDGWIAFEYLRRNLPLTVAIKAEHPQADAGCYDASSWRHPTKDAEPYTLPHDPGALLQWARQKTYFPVVDGPAWEFVAGYLCGLNAAAAEEAKAIESRLDAAQKDARELQNRDWDRLKDGSAKATLNDSSAEAK